MFALLVSQKGCSLHAPCSSSPDTSPARMIQMANVHVGNDNDYSFSGESAEKALLESTKVHGNKLPHYLLQSTRSGN